MSRSDQDAVDTNPNTEYTHTVFFHLFYVGLVVAFILLCTFFAHSQDLSWTIINVVHALTTFYFFHWLKGNPLGEDYFKPGKYDRLTYWEQIDNERQFTFTKKFLLFVPIVLLIVTAYTAYHFLLLNLIASAFVIVPKFPSFHRVRLFGINA